MCAGFLPPPVKPRVPAHLALLALLAIPATTAKGQDVKSHTFVASVFDAASGEPVVGAFATALGTERFATTDHNGSFRIDGLPVGSHAIRIWRLGYSPIMFRVTLDSNTVHVLSVPIVLEPVPIRLPEVVVEGDRTVLVAAGPLHDFYRRRNEGRGWFFTRAEIEERGADELQQIVRRVPGTNVQYLGNLRWTIQLVDNSRGACPVVYFVDGIQSNESMALSLKPERLEGIEIYRRPSEIPPEFNVRGASCGVIALWSRR